MRHLVTITVGAALVVAAAGGSRTSTDALTPTAGAPTASVSISAPGTLATTAVRVMPVAHHKPAPRCPGVGKQKTRKGRCIGVGSRTYGGITYGTVPGTIINPGPTPRIVTFGNGAGSGITTFGHSLGANPNAGTGPFGHLGGTTVGQ